MNNVSIQRVLVMLILLLGAVSVSSAADRFYMNSVNIEPGSSADLEFVLENTTEYYGFQVDIKLPEGLDFVKIDEGKANVWFSDRATGKEYNIVSNLISPNEVKLGAFSSLHQSFSGNDGVLLYAKVTASDNFTGGNVEVTNVRFIKGDDNDEKLSNTTAEVTVGVDPGPTVDDRFYMKPVEVELGGTTTLEFMLENSLNYYGFQADIELPEGMTFAVSDTYISLSDRAKDGDYRIVTNLLSDNKLRVGTFSANGTPFTGNEGVLLNVNVKISNDFTGGKVCIKDISFVNSQNRDIELPDTFAEITVKANPIPVSKITLSPESWSGEVDDSISLTATIEPEDADNKSIEWTSSDETIATVTEDGVVTALKAGKAIVTATCGTVSTSAAITVVKVPDTLTMTFDKTEVKQGETVTMSISFDSAENLSYAGLQFTVTVPEGMTVEPPTLNSELNAFEIKTTPKGNDIVYMIYRLNVEYTEVISNIVQIPLKAGDTMPVGNAEIKITDIKLNSSINNNNGKHVLTNTSSTIKVVEKEVAITAIELTPSTLDIYKGDNYSETIAAIITPSDATNQDLEWIVEDKSILSVSVAGNKATITGEEFGTTTITVRAKDGSGISAVAEVKVIPIPAKSITLEGTSVTTLKEREENQLTAKVFPEDTTYPEVEWKSSNEKVATVDTNGLVTAVGEGNVVITATVKATPTVYATYNLEVEALLLGDSNEDTEVDVFDVVNIGNYIIGRDPKPFCFVASDVIYDKQINVADQNATVNIALGLPVEGAAKLPSRSSMTYSGKLIADDIIFMTDGKVHIPILLSSDMGYSSLQADVILPEGMDVESVYLTSLVASHNLMYNVTADGVLKVVIYSFENAILPVDEGPIFEIVIETNGKNGFMDMENILASTPDCSLFNLQFESCEINNEASVDKFINESIIVRGVKGAIEIINGNGKEARVFDMRGRLIASVDSSTSNEAINVARGFYIVIVDNIRFKISVP